MRKYVLLFYSLLIGASALADATYTNHYVWTASANPGNPYNAWTNAARDIQSALNVARAGDTVWVTNGIYTNTATLTITNAVILKSVNGRDVTIINGNYPSISQRALIFSTGADGAVVDGFTVTNGYSSTAAGVYIHANGSRNSILRNCIITGNRGVDGGHGAGVNVGGTGLVEYCTIVGNGATNYSSSGGIYAQANSTVQYCRVIGNIASGGGGISAGAGTVIRNCEIISNASYSTTGGGMNMSGSTIQDCLIYTNVALSGTSYGGGLYVGANAGYPPGKIQNCTIVKNASGGGGQGGGVYVAGNATGEFANTIISYNYGAAAKNLIVLSGTNLGWSTFSNCCFESKYDWDPGYGRLPAEWNSIWTNNFGAINKDAGNFRLLKTSPCVNAGINQGWMTGAIDLDGHDRIMVTRGTNVDMGAYEYWLSKGTIFTGR